MTDVAALIYQEPPSTNHKTAPNSTCKRNYYSTLATDDDEDTNYDYYPSHSCDESINSTTRSRPAAKWSYTNQRRKKRLTRFKKRLATTNNLFTEAMDMNRWRQFCDDDSDHSTYELPPDAIPPPPP